MELLGKLGTGFAVLAFAGGALAILLAAGNDYLLGLHLSLHRKGMAVMWRWARVSISTLSARKDVLIGGAVLGLPRARVLALAQLDAIADFVALGDCFDRPIRYYSSGMVARLAFAICVHVEDYTLIIDEALAVGDQAFRVKCMDFLENCRRRGTILFVLHNLEQVNRLCNRAAWHDGGLIRSMGAAEAVTEEYKAALENKKDNAKRFWVGA